MDNFFQLVSPNHFKNLLESFKELETENLLISDALNRIVARTIISPEQLPPFSRSTMDGYAVKAQNTFGCSESEPVLLQIIGEISMGSSGKCFSLKAGQTSSIWTGGELPNNADAVVMVEYTNRIDDTTIEVFKAVAPGENVIQAGDDIRKGDKVIDKGKKLRPQDLGLLAGLGQTHIDVVKKPIIGIISTGDELVYPNETPSAGQIRDINTTTLSSLILESVAIPVTYGIIGDDFPAMLKACKKALEHPVDILLLSGGSSVGKRDFTLSVFKALKNTNLLAHGVAIRPGKPTLLAQHGNQALLGLPGHVASAMVVFHLFVRHLIFHFMGAKQKELQHMLVQTGEQIPSVIGREDYVRVHVEKQAGTYPLAFPIYGKSGLLKPLVAADGLLKIDRDCEGIDKDQLTEVLLFP